MEAYLKITVSQSSYMGLSEAKFYFYSMDAVDQEQNQVSLKELISKIDFSKINTLIQSGGGKFTNAFYIERGPEEFYKGCIVRSKDKNSFFIKDGSKLRELKDFVTNTDCEVGDKEKDFVNFIFRPQNGELIFLLETAFQTPGMGIIEQFFKKILEDYHVEIHYKPKSIEKVRNSFIFFSNKSIKKVTLKFKKNPEIPDTCKKLEDSFNSMAPDDFVLTVEASVGKPKKNQTYPSFGDIYQKFFGIPISENVAVDVDFPAFLTNLRVEAIIGEGQPTIEEDILEQYEKVVLKLDKTILPNRGFLSEGLFEKLYANFAEKMNLDIELNIDDSDV